MTRKSKPPPVAISFAPDALEEWIRVKDARVLSNRSDYNRYLGLLDQGLADEALVRDPQRKNKPNP